MEALCNVLNKTFYSIHARMTGKRRDMTEKNVDSYEKISTKNSKRVPNL